MNLAFMRIINGTYVKCINNLYKLDMYNKLTNLRIKEDSPI